MALTTKETVRQIDFNDSIKKIYPNESPINFVITKDNAYAAIKEILKAGTNVTIDTNDTGKTITLRSTAVGGSGAGLRNFACLYGMTARRSTYGSEASKTADALSEGRSAFAGTNFQTKTVTLATGGLFAFSFSSVQGWYRPWVALPVGNLHTIRIYDKSNDQEVSSWAIFSAIKNSISYNVYVRENPIEQGRSEEWTIKNYS